MFNGAGEYATFLQTVAKGFPGANMLLGVMLKAWKKTEHFDWVMPDGHHVHVPVVATTRYKMKFNNQNYVANSTDPNTSKEFTEFNYSTKELTPHRKGLALAANITHATDAYVCREMVRGCVAHGIKMYPVHDCFYSHPNNFNYIRQRYLQIMQSIADMDLMSDMLTQIKGSPVRVQKLDKHLSKKMVNAEYPLS